MVDATSELPTGARGASSRRTGDWNGFEPDERVGNDEAVVPKSRLKGRLVAGGLAALLLIPFGLGLSSRFSGGQSTAPVGPSIGTPYAVQGLSVIGAPVRGAANVTGVLPGLPNGIDAPNAQLPALDLPPDALKALEERIAQFERRVVDAEKRIAATEASGVTSAAQALSSTAQSGDLRTAIADVRKDLGELALRHDASLEGLLQEVAALRKAAPAVRSGQAGSKSPTPQRKARPGAVAPPAKGCSLRGVMAALRDGEPAAWIATGSGEAHTYRVGDAVKCLGRITDIEPGVTGGIVRGTLGVLRE